MTEVTAQARHKQSREAAPEEMSLQTSAKSRQRMRMLCAAADRFMPPTGKVRQNHIIWWITWSRWLILRNEDYYCCCQFLCDEASFCGVTRGNVMSSNTLGFLVEFTGRTSFSFCLYQHMSILWPLCRTICVSQHPQLRMEDFIVANFYWPHALADGN